jgi:hypothetical protein
LLELSQASFIKTIMKTIIASNPFIEKSSARIFSAFVLGLLIVCGLAVIGNASCPHCQAIVEVTVELKDGNVRHGYFGYHQEVLPSAIDTDGRVVISLSVIPTDFYPKNTISLLDTVVIIPGLGKFARLSNIDFIAVVDIERMVLESWLTQPEADRIQYLEAGPIELLSSQDLVRFDTTIGLSVMHLVSLNDSVTLKNLQRLARNRELLGGFQDHFFGHLSIQLRYMQQMENSTFAGQLTKILVEKHAKLMEMEKALDSLAGSDIIGQHFVVVYNHVKQWTDFINNLLVFLRNGNRQPLDNAILYMQRDGGLPDDIADHPYEINGSVDSDGITYLIKSYIEKHQIAIDLGEDYSRYLNAHDVYIFEQAFD